MLVNKEHLIENHIQCIEWVPHSMTLSDLWPRIQGHNIFRHWLLQPAPVFASLWALFSLIIGLIHCVNFSIYSRQRRMTSGREPSCVVVASDYQLAVRDSCSGAITRTPAASWCVCVTSVSVCVKWVMNHLQTDNASSLLCHLLSYNQNISTQDAHSSHRCTFWI